MLEAAQVIVYEQAGMPQAVTLQLCERHAVQAIKRRLVTARRYTKERRDELILMI